MEEKDLVKNLSLALIYLTSWTENKGTDFEVKRSWRSYDWDALDELEESEFISFSRKAKSVYLTDEGAEVAKRLVEALRKVEF